MVCSAIEKGKSRKGNRKWESNTTLNREGIIKMMTFKQRFEGSEKDKSWYLGYSRLNYLFTIISSLLASSNFPGFGYVTCFDLWNMNLCKVCHSQVKALKCTCLVWLCPLLNFCLLPWTISLPKTGYLDLKMRCVKLSPANPRRATANLQSSSNRRPWDSVIVCWGRVIVVECTLSRGNR